MSMSEGMIQSLIELDKQGELPLENSLDAMTLRAARLINRSDLGCIQYGHSADCVLIDPDGQTHFDPTNRWRFLLLFARHIVGLFRVYAKHKRLL